MWRHHLREKFLEGDRLDSALEEVFQSCFLHASATNNYAIEGSEIRLQVRSEKWLV